MRCTVCGEENKVGARYCANCGQTLAGGQSPRVPVQILGGQCANCGAQNRPGVRFCENCGAAMGAAYAAQPQPLQPIQPVQPVQPVTVTTGGSGWGFAGGIIVAGVVLFLLVGGVVAAYFIFGGGKAAASPPPPISQMVVFTATLASQPQQVQQQAPAPVQPTVVQPTATLRPPDTSVPASTATLGPPMFTADMNSLCRRGPSQIYVVHTSMNAGDTVKILGKSGPNWEDWWNVEVSGAKCWVWSGLGQASGDLSNIPVVQAPPTPTPTKTPIPLPQTCTGTEGFGPLQIGSKVILQKHRPVNGVDNWVSPDMDAFLGQTANVTSLAGYDSQNCPGIRIDLDAGKWFWRLRDLKLP